MEVLLPIFFLTSVVLLLATLGLFLKFRSKMARVSTGLEQEKYKLSSMVTSLMDGIIMVDASNEIQISNPSSLKLLGLEAKEGYGAVTLNQVFETIGARANLKGAIDQARSTQTVVSLSEFTIDNKTLQIDVEPVKNHQPGEVLLVIHDQSAQKEIERLHQEFTAMMVHELRTPLTTLTYSTNMMISELNTMTNEQLSSQLLVVQSTVSHLLSLVNDLLDVAKIEAGKFQIVKQNDSLKRLIEEKLATFKPLADQKNLNLKIEVDPNLTDFPFDQNRIGQVLDNLVSNAIKYTENGTVAVKAGVRNYEVLVEVTDTGDGIRPEDLTKLFSKFQQFGKGKTGEKKGTGLGLVIVKGIVEAHGGKISAHSPGPGQGSTFSFTLPLIAPTIQAG